MQVDQSKIPNLEGRRECAKLYQASVDADRLLEEAEERVGAEEDPKYEAMREEVRKDYFDKRAAADTDRSARFKAASEDYQQRMSAIDLQEAAERGVTALKEQAMVAQEAYSEHPETVSTDDDGTILFCALSGEPILDSDEILRDENEEELIIRGIVLPPKDEDLADIDAEDEAA